MALSVGAFLLSRTLLAHRKRQEQTTPRAPKSPKSPRTPRMPAPTPRKPHPSLKELDGIYHTFSQDVASLEERANRLEQVRSHTVTCHWAGRTSCTCLAGSLIDPAPLDKSGGARGARRRRSKQVTPSLRGCAL